MPARYGGHPTAAVTLWMAGVSDRMWGSSARLLTQARRKHIELLCTGYMELMADKEERRRAWGH